LPYIEGHAFEYGAGFSGALDAVHALRLWFPEEPEHNDPDEPDDADVRGGGARREADQDRTRNR
jgi:hypothetical protein